jgi:sarcosine oxidase, subunit alpha
MMTVDGTPNVRVCAEPVREGAHLTPQNVLGSLEHDLLAVTDKIGGPFTPVGFYYRTMIRPRRAWPLYEKFLRNVAGLGRIDPHAERSDRYDTEHRHAEVLVIGASEAGVARATELAEQGRHVVLVDENSSAPGIPGVEVIAPGRALGIWEGGLVPVDAGNVLYRYRVEQIVAATGAIEQPLVFPGNDLVGVMLPEAVRRLVDDWAIRPGQRAVVVTVDENGREAAARLKRIGVEIGGVYDLRRERIREIVGRGRKGVLRSVELDGRRIDCDLLVMSGGRQPAYSLLAQAGARVEYVPESGAFLPTEIPEGIEAVGSVAGEGLSAAIPAATYNGASGKGKCFVCVCEDVTDKDLKRAIAEGFDSLELAKRYTTVTMGPCQGRLCHVPSIRVFARENESDPGTIGTTTARPPWGPVTLGVLAGRPHEPAQRSSIHHRHKELGGRMMWTGTWRRPHSYGDVEAEVQAVHGAVGLIDVSTLGKLLVIGPDAGEFLERLYPNRFGDMKAGRIRYAVLNTDAGRIMDDGTIARLSEDAYYVTTTSTGAGAVVEWFEWWNAVWGMDVQIADITGALAAVNVAGPRARELMSRLTDVDVSNEALSYLDARQGKIAGVPSLVLRIGFVGELGYELHFPSPYGEFVWDTILERGEDLGIRPFGLEPQRILRLEKMHILVGQDTDSESNVIEANMPWIVKFDKDDFVGKWALEHVQARGPREQLVGFEMEDGRVPPEGGQVVIKERRPVGRITSARWSPELRKVIGMAWVPPELAHDGAEFFVTIDGGFDKAQVRLTPFFDPQGERLRS